MNISTFRMLAGCLAFALAGIALLGAAKDPIPKKYYDKANPLWPIERVDQPPVPLEQPPPVLPAKDALVKGSVVVSFIISKTGVVEFPAISKSSDPRLDEPTLEAVRKWKFKPAVKNGNPANCYVGQRLDFN